MSETNPSPAEAPLFDAELRPHRSLSPRGFLLLMTAIGTLSFCAGLGFFLAGAWPVIGFLGLDVLLIYLAFKASYRSGRLVERLQLTPQQLIVGRTWPSGRHRAWNFQPYWLQVDYAKQPQHDSQLVLCSHGQSLVIGSFLTKEERGEVAEALRAALARSRETPLES